MKTAATAAERSIGDTSKALSFYFESCTQGHFIVQLNNAYPSMQNLS